MDPQSDLLKPCFAMSTLYYISCPRQQLHVISFIHINLFCNKAPNLLNRNKQTTYLTGRSRYQPNYTRQPAVLYPSNIAVSQRNAFFHRIRIFTPIPFTQFA